MLKNIDYKIALNSKEGNETLLSLEKVKKLYLELVLTFLDHTMDIMNHFKITNLKQNWYGSSQLGINMSLPIFSSLQRTASTQRAKIELEKAELNLKETASTLNLEVQKARNDYNFSINNYETALKNLSLAESIEKKNQIKFYEGLSSSFDLRQAQNQLYTIQNEYLEATLKIIENKINLEILLNKS